MEIEDSGHKHWLDSFDGGERQLLTYVKREGENYPGNVGHYPGTQMQEVLRSLVERGQYVNNQFSCDETTQAINHFKSAIYMLEKRHSRIHGGILEVNLPIELMSYCKNCGHIMCYCP